MHLTPDDLRIRQALEQIETPMYDIADAVREQRARRSRRVPLGYPPRMLAALLAALLLTATVATAAMQLSGGWAVLFGQGIVMPDGLATPVYQTQTVGNCTVSLEDAIVTDGSVAVLYSLRYTNAAPLHSDTYTTLLGSASLLLDGTEDACVSSSGTGTFDGNRPGVEYFYDAFTLSEDPGDRTLTLEIAPASLLEYTDPQSAPVDLAAIYTSHPVTHLTEDDGETRLAALRQQDCADTVLPQSYQSPAIRFAGVAFEGDALCVSLTMPSYDGFDGESAQIDALRDIRTDRLYYGSVHTYSGVNDTLDLCQTSFEGLTEADLPYLEPQVSYHRSTPLTDKGWSFTFCAPSAQTLTRTLSLDTVHGMHIEKMTITPLGIELTGTEPIPAAAEEHTFDNAQDPSVTLLLHDGTAVSAEARGWSHSYDEADNTQRQSSIEYEFRSDVQSRRFLQTESIAAVRIDNTTITIDE